MKEQRKVEVVTDAQTLSQKSIKCGFLKLERMNNDSVIEDMFSVIRENNKTCLGLAAIQVGVAKRIILIRDPSTPPAEVICEVMINPEIYCRTGGISRQKEGCLSFPNRDDIPVRRYKKIKVRYQQRKGVVKEVTLTGLIARIVQHEIDHLDGVLV